MTTLIPIIGISIVFIVLAIYIFFPKIKGLHITSRLTCSRCGGTFDYNWLPGGSFDAIRWGKYRFMRCQICGKASWFDIWSTRIQ